MLDEEDEETLKELLRDELGLGYESKVCIYSIFLLSQNPVGKLWERGKLGRKGRKRDLFLDE